MYEIAKEEIIPRKWYNIAPDLPEPLSPPRDHDTEKSSIDLLNRILPKEILRQEFTSSRYENIPDEVIEQYLQIGRPTPLVRALNMEKLLNFRGKYSSKMKELLPQVLTR
jgi:tryptophan synthase, beta chain (EC 4.2.1.20)